MASNRPMSPRLEQIHGEIRDHFRALANGFQKLDKIKDSTRQSKAVANLQLKKMFKWLHVRVLTHTSMSNQEFVDAGMKRMDETDQAIEHSKQVSYRKEVVEQTLEVGTQTAANLKGQVILQNSLHLFLVKS
ncbi:unnamed protein product [Brassica rapa subsp. narinosa]